MKTLRTFADRGDRPAHGCSRTSEGAVRLYSIDVPGAAATYADGNSTHEIAGEFDDEDGNTHGFVLSKGVFHRVDVPNAKLHQRQRDQRERRPFRALHQGQQIPRLLLEKRGLTMLDPPGSILSAANFLNAHGQVVGIYRSPDNTRHGFLWSQGVFTTLDPPGASRPWGATPWGSTTSVRS